MMAWTTRKTIDYQVSNLPIDSDNNIKIIDPSNIRVILPGFVVPFDIGSWCYSKRRTVPHNRKTTAGATKEIVPESLMKSRREFVINYLEYISLYIKLGKSAHTISTSTGQFQRFVAWCDHNFLEALDNQNNYVEAVSRYTDELIHQIKSNKININTAASFQLVMKNVGKNIYGDPYDELFRNVRKISRSLAATEKTEVPDLSKAKKAIKIYQQVFHQLSNFVVNEEKFPAKILIDNDTFWHFPSSIPYGGATTIRKKQALRDKFISYDYENGKVRSLEEAISLSKTKDPAIRKISAEKAIKNAKILINSSNTNKFHHRRLDAALFAAQAFLMLFSAHTGMNLSQINSITWSEKFNTDKEKIGFKSIKYRANGKLNKFYISNSFSHTFKKYIALRKYILGAIGCNEFPTLFFNVIDKKPRYCGMNISTTFHKRIKVCFDIDIKVTTRMWRAMKADWLIRNTDITTTSLILQNSESTIIKHYSEGSQTSQANEVSNFLDQYKSVVSSNGDLKTTRTIAGSCSDYRNPSQIIDYDMVSDCSSPEGCIFCDKYRVLPNEEDIRKLFSLLYVIKISKPLALNESHYLRFSEKATGAIHAIIEAIKETKLISEEIISKISSEVMDNEKLTPYWTRKLAMLEDIGIEIL
jgi:hypothetical protein